MWQDFCIIIDQELQIEEKNESSYCLDHLLCVTTYISLCDSTHV